MLPLNKKIKRYCAMAFIPRFLTLCNDSFFLLGPRGTGKSMWLKHTLKNTLVINLLDPAVHREYSAKPERLKELIDAHPAKQVVIDEVQKVPELLSVVHQLIEEKRDIQFILTGSSARKLKRTGVNLLAGRALMSHLHPFMASELQTCFDLNTALEFGLLPVIFGSTNAYEKLRAYVGLYLKEEVQTEGLVRNIGDFSRFLEIVSFSHAQQLNVSNIARECSISRKIVEAYLSILEDLLLSFTLPVFTKRAKRETANHPKFYLFDTGVFRFLRAQGPMDTTHELLGPALEGLVAQHLRAWIDYSPGQYSLHYWRTRAGNEVDFIVYGTDVFWAIEVKCNEHIRPQELNGLKAFYTDYPECTPILLYRGKETLKKDNILCIPVHVFLLQLNPKTPQKEILCTKH
jgi:predicted AAA+ superfamily ATPase